MSSRSSTDLSVAPGNSAAGGSCPAAGPAPACRVEPAGPPVVLPDRDGWQTRRRRAIWRRAALAGQGFTTVILDIGGVIVPSLFESVALPDFPRGPLAAEPAYREVEQGRRSERAYWAGVAEQRPDLDLGRLWRDCTGLRPAMMAAIATMLSRMRVVAFTNDMAYWFGDDWLTGRFADLQALDDVLEARDFGVLKPDPRAYHLAAERIGEKPEHCLFVDDHQANLDGAAAVGMATQLFDVTTPQQTVAALLARLALPEAEPPRIFRQPATGEEHGRQARQRRHAGTGS
ncbi:HAD-IA family hydrolase [Actinoplanes sp. NPDC023801]|uniref:HAD-IA family hydrolase n=1 Tax=Actinoplanes sp. NPDC023801 TaxID=3154595 RepID=UPI0033D01D89